MNFFCLLFIVFFLNSCGTEGILEETSRPRPESSVDADDGDKNTNDNSGTDAGEGSGEDNPPNQDPPTPQTTEVICIAPADSPSLCERYQALKSTALTVEFSQTTLCSKTGQTDKTIILYEYSASGNPGTSLPL